MRRRRVSAYEMHIEHSIDWVTLLSFCQQYGETDDWNETVQAIVRLAMASEKPGEINSAWEMTSLVYGTCTCRAVIKTPFFRLWEDVDEACEFIIWANEHCFIGREYDEKAWRKYRDSKPTEQES